MATDLETVPPRVFVASSKRSLSLAKLLAGLLQPEIVADVWDTAFKPGDNTLDNLILFGSLYEFGLFVLSADDLTDTQDGAQFEPRDNVIFELGIFMGALGRRRAIAVVVADDQGKVKLPSDLSGNTYVSVSRARLESADLAKQEVAVIRQAIMDLSGSAPLTLLPATSLATGYFHNFILPVGRFLQDISELPTSALSVDLAKRGYDFTVLIPNSLSKIGVADRDMYVKRIGWRSCAVPLPVVGKVQRSYDFFADDSTSDGPVQLYDYPTTLRSAHEAIRLVLREGALGERQREYDILAAREIRTFARALNFLLSEPDGQVFPNPVAIRYI